MPKTRKSHPPSLKAKVAVEAIKAHKTAAQNSLALPRSSYFSTTARATRSCLMKWNGTRTS